MSEVALPIEKLAYGVDEACAALSISSTRLQKLVHDGKLEVRLVDDRVTITRASLDIFIAGLPPRQGLVAGFVYFACFGDSGPIKIGFATNVAARIGQLQIAAPEKIRLLCSIPGTLEDEGQLHRRFQKHHIRGEWFRADAELLAHIEGLKK